MRTTTAGAVGPPRSRRRGAGPLHDASRHGAEAAPVEQDHGWFVYAVVDAGSELPAGLDGIHDAQVELVPCGSVAAVVSRFDLTRPAARSADLWSFHGVVDAAAEALEAV